MMPSALPTVVRQLRMLSVDATRDLTDAQLLTRFTSRQDEEAFTVLMNRHGRIVWSVCRNQLGHEQDAEDAFQATFLTLARNARRIQKQSSLGCWLHGVAYRISLKTRREAARRRGREQKAANGEATPVVSESAWRALQAVLDEEVQNLPEKLRVPFVLCCLEGRAQPDVAATMGWKLGTVSGRLTKARQLLLERLARRGISLSAVLTAVTLMRDSASAAVPSRLMESPVTASAFTANDVTRLANLAEHAAPAVNLTSFKFAAVLLTLAGIVGAVFLADRGQPVSASAPLALVEEKAANSAERELLSQPPRTVEANPLATEVRGQVLDPDGKPAANAEIYVWTDAIKNFADMKPIANADSDGRFQFKLPAETPTEGAKLVAVKKGVAPDWLDLDSHLPGSEAMLRLVKDDFPITGRVLDLEGRPIPGIAVELRWLGKHPSGKIDMWIQKFIDANGKGFWIHEEGLQIIRPWALGVPTLATTDKDGRFQLTGLGRDRMATVLVKSEKTEQLRLQLMARDGPKGGWVKGTYGLHPNGSDFIVGPCKPVVGTVRDRKTGKPIAGITVSDETFLVQTTTDANGRYRMFGCPKRERYTFATGGNKGVPYLDFTKQEVADSPGLDPLTVDFDLERGVEITGKVTDSSNGKPVRGSVSWSVTRGNPNRKDFLSLEGGRMIVSDWGKIAPDGSFTVLAIPGPGVLWVQALPSNKYARIDVQGMHAKLDLNGWPSDPTHAYAQVNPVDGEPKTLHYEIKLNGGVSRPGNVLDADGKSLSGTRVAGLTDAENPTRLATADFNITGLSTDRERALVFLHEEKKLGAVVGARGDSDKSMAVALQPLGALKGRIVDADSKPLAKRKVVVLLVLDRKRFDNLPNEFLSINNVHSIHPGAWKNFTAREAITADDGSFHIDGLIPGERYDLYAGLGKVTSGGSVSHQHRNFTVEPGKVKDAGDLKSNTKE
jgi:RNA polymerase sigma factor (sigma-70 family)